MGARVRRTKCCVCFVTIMCSYTNLLLTSFCWTSYLISSYAPKHPVLYRSIKETLSNLANRKAVHVYDISFWSYYNAWRNSPYNQSYMPGWGEAFGGRIHFQNNDVKDVMVENATHWQVQKQIWHPECLK